MMSDSQLVIALTKGRVMEETLPLLEQAGIIPEEPPSESRKLIFGCNLPDVRLMVLRGVDVPTYVALGSADIGITGKDILMENPSQAYYEPLDLKLARCRLMTAAPADRAIDRQRLRVASKFVNIAKGYFSRQGRQADIIKLNGALELAPLMGLADCIVDIVDTGNTLRANGLEPRELIAEVSTRVIVNKASMKLKHEQVHNLLRRLGEAVAEQNGDDGR